MNGIAPTRIVGFKWDGEGWVQVPVQVDERKTVSVSSLYPDDPVPILPLQVVDLTFDLEVYADDETRTGPDEDPKLDANDEVAFMADDTGSKAAPATTAPEGPRGTGGITSAEGRR